VREGDDVCLVGVGKLLDACVGAADLLAADGIEATVWDPRLVKPLDPELIDDAARFAAVVTAEDGLRLGGAGTALADALAQRATVGGPNPVVRTLGVPDAYVPQGKPDDILADLGLDATGIASSVHAVLAR